MSKTRPATSGYARLAQAEEERGYLHDDSEDDDIGAFSVDRKSVV